MDPERWQKIADLYQAAQGEPKNLRAAFLDRACGGDEALRRADIIILGAPHKCYDHLEISGSKIMVDVWGRWNKNLAATHNEVLSMASA